MAQSKNIALILSIALIFISSACHKSPDGCDRFENWKIISEKDRAEACIYQQIYLYKDEYYTICECCVCDKVSIAALDCNEEPLCEFSEDCMIDFYDNAEYLFSAVEE